MSTSSFINFATTKQQLFKCEASQLEINVKRIKKDAIWKPLLRGLRTFARDLISVFVDINNIYDKEGDLNNKTIEGCKNLLKQLGAPDEMLEKTLYHHAMVVLLAPCSIKNLSRFFHGLPSV